MITEDYVSFEIAKLLKDKGFDEKCLHYYEDNRHRDEGIKFSNWCNIEYSNSEIGRRFTCPTLQMAMKWLRETHKTFISITYENDGVFTVNLKSPLKGVDCMVDNKHNCWLTYEEAAEEAIKFCLEKNNLK